MKQIKKSRFFEFSLLIITFLIEKSSSSPSSSSSSPDFTYTVSHFWPKMYPGCDGQRQSPITFTWKNMVIGQSEDYFSIINYGNKPLSANVTNNKHTLKVRFEWDENQTPYLTGGIMGENEYVLDSMDFHWNRLSSKGAEHCYTDDCATMEMYLIHYNRNYGSFQNALNYTDGLVIYSVLLSYWERSLPLSWLLSYVLENVESVAIPGSSVDIEPFVISKVNGYKAQQSEFLAYFGSLTTPPCTENVLWLLSVKNIHVKEEEIKLLQKTVQFGFADHHNNRPFQPLNGRVLSLINGYGDIV